MRGRTDDSGAIRWSKIPPTVHARAGVASGADVRPPVLADRPRMRILASLLAAFALGGVLGAIGFQRIGYAATLPLALLLGGLSAVPVFDDLSERLAS